VSGVRFNDRALLVGSTGSGKSELLNWLFANLRCQRLLLDSKDEFSVRGDDGRLVEPVSDVESIDWSERTVHFKTSPIAGPEDYDALFERCYSRRNLVVVVHELADVCDFNPNRTPRWFNAYVSKGRARGLGLYAGTQRPVQVPVRARTENEHVFMVGERLVNRNDHAEVASWMGQHPAELARLIDRVQEQLGGEPDEQGRRHAYLWFQRASQSVTACPPLPAEHRRAIARLIGRTESIDRGEHEHQ
jgi:energy-coupling factor transporter ATP-binding protein EcfA2